MQQSLLNNLTSCAKYWKVKSDANGKNKYIDILSLSDKQLYVFYHEVNGFQTSWGKGKHWDIHILHIRSRDKNIRKKFRIRIRQWVTAVPLI